MQSPTRIMAFYDGNYFKQGNVYFRYKEGRGWFHLTSLHDFFEQYIASKAKVPVETTKVVAAHYYDGRTSTTATRSEHLTRERDYEMALIEAGIVPHYLPVTEKLKPGSPHDSPTFTFSQKGVDVKLALDVLDAAHSDRFDVALLIAGDADFIPLVRMITSLGKQTVVAHFNIEQWIDQNGFPHKPTYCSKSLIAAASYSLNFNLVVNDPEWKAQVGSLFFQPRKRDEKDARE